MIFPEEETTVAMGFEDRTADFKDAARQIATKNGYSKVICNPQDMFMVNAMSPFSFTNLQIWNCRADLLKWKHASTAGEARLLQVHFCL